MNDLEICKRIAEIEGFEPNVNTDNECCKDATGNSYNPLTNDALCFKLMVKYEVDITSPYRPNGETLWCADIFVNGYVDALSTRSESPNKAICLAIIEAHND